MAHEILSVKLYELDKKLGQVHSRIKNARLCATAKISRAGFWKRPPHGALRYRNPLFRSQRSMLMFFGRGNRKSPWEKRG